MTSVLIFAMMQAASIAMGSVSKQKYIYGPPDLMLYCVHAATRGNIITCADAASAFVAYNYSFAVQEDRCSFCRVTDKNVTSLPEHRIKGPHLFAGGSNVAFSGPFYRHGLTWITAWIRIKRGTKSLTDSRTSTVWEWISYFIAHFIGHVIIHLSLG